MTKHIRNLITVMATAITCFAGPSAKADPVPEQTPMTTANSFSSSSSDDITTHFLEQAFESARINSPFASFTAEPSEPAFQSATLAGKMVDYASRFLGTRYRRGATGPKAFDCSGFTSYVFRNFGITLDRTSRQQYLQGDKVSLGNLRPGDLLFFSSRSSGRGNVGHVAMVTEVNPDGSCKFIHASSGKGRVTYQTFPDNGYYERNFVGARRILGTSLAQNSSLAQK